MYYPLHRSRSLSSRLSASTTVSMSMFSGRSIKSFASAILITLGVVSFFLQCSRWGPGNRKTLNISDTAAETAPASSIPEKIWYKVGPKGISTEAREWMNTCLEKNPTFEHEILTDSLADTYVIERFVHRPEIVETYLALSIPILKADLLRYLLLFAEGGLWSDLDVSCGDTPIRDWIPEQYRNNASLVVGWEFQTVDDQHMREFVTWMIMSKPGLPHMSMVINDTLQALHEKAREHKVPISGLNMDMVGDIVWLTGPMAMSKSIIKSLGIEKDNINSGATPYVFEPQLFDDVLILPGYSFSASMQQYKDEEHPGPALVTHHYVGSWKNGNGGEEANPVS
ncbi:related to alpha-1,6-mannosyltransferase [Phialocephala subalpina]|uniref:Related to alpha-1,6-mannosyltransferase n=1 Tax=Phialocephala subalpina TaxID=576137 RepID=A0A1L7XJR7_9HELO|nr:related to alpha-1,6-mannosyltransferase [Phialocephala subalpina]